MGPAPSARLRNFAALRQVTESRRAAGRTAFGV